ncbi:MAG: hypothetical protein MUD14_18805 [Hydrococcus sp. Prado102]|nr:hypothetical protein [Hydrococcus sp. Prado102]
MPSLALTFKTSSTSLKLCVVYGIDFGNLAGDWGLGIFQLSVTSDQ